MHFMRVDGSFVNTDDKIYSNGIQIQRTRKKRIQSLSRLTKYQII